MSGIDSIYQNYDKVFKDAVSLYKDKTLDFFGMDKSLKIKEPLKTETAEIKGKNDVSNRSLKRPCSPLPHQGIRRSARVESQPFAALPDS